MLALTRWKIDSSWLPPLISFLILLSVSNNCVKPPWGQEELTQPLVAWVNNHKRATHYWCSIISACCLHLLSLCRPQPIPTTVLPRHCPVGVKRYPGLHSQRYPPGMFKQAAFCWHTGPFWHSSISRDHRKMVAHFERQWACWKQMIWLCNLLQYNLRKYSMALSPYLHK